MFGEVDNRARRYARSEGCNMFLVLCQKISRRLDVGAVRAYYLH